jgi:cystathionine gamma-synthase
VYYPGLATHPDHTVATECFSGHGHLITIALRGGDGAVGTALNRLQWFRVQDAAGAARLGGVESVASPLEDGSIRLSIGLDAASTLIGDLTQALE